MPKAAVPTARLRPLEESGFSDESISLAGYRSSSWEFGGYTYDISPMVSERLQVV